MQKLSSMKEKYTSIIYPDLDNKFDSHGAIEDIKTEVWILKMAMTFFPILGFTIAIVVYYIAAYNWNESASTFCTAFNMWMALLMFMSVRTTSSIMTMLVKLQTELERPQKQ